MGQYDSLLQPGLIGPMKLKNRMIMSAMGLNTGTPDGLITDEEIEYYRQRAAGGVGLIQVGSATIGHPEFVVAPRESAISDDKHIPQLKKLADTLHKYNCKLSVQLHHGGTVCVGMSGFMGYPIYVPSPVPYHADGTGSYNELDPDQRAMLLGEVPPMEFRVCTKEDIRHFVELYGDAAERCVKAGCDCVEIHGGHGYLIDSFLNPRYNSRTDEYGGSLENRARFYVEIVQEIRKRVGNKLAIICKLDAMEFAVEEEDGPGITNEQAVQTAKLLEAAGADCIAASAYAPVYKVICPTVSHVSFEPNKIVPYAKKIREAVSIPVTAVGNISMEDAAAFIAAGDFDFIQIARKLLADPELPNKVAENRMEDARLCLNCYVCLSQMYQAGSVKCAINPACCNETQVKIEPAKKVKRVVVVGGGPAGMETARVAAERGHKVTIIEKGDKLGGTLFFASVCTPTNYRIVNYLENQLQKLGVKVMLNTVADRPIIDGLRPDVVVIATGSKRELPNIPGCRQRHVMDGDTSRDMITGAKSKRDTGAFTKFMCSCGRALGMLATPEKVSKNSHIWMPIGKNVVLYGGELVGLEMAEFLHERGRKVMVIEPGDYVGEGLSLVRRWKVVDDLKRAGVPVLVNCEAKEIGKNTFTYVDGNGAERTVPADTVIVCTGAVPNTDLKKSLSTAHYEVYEVGDCNDKLSFIEGAIHEGNKVGREI